jgi:hypothetical protein
MVIDSAHVRKAFSPGGGGGAQNCRITVTPDPCPLHKSNGAYSAYTPLDKKSGGGYERHDGEFCDCGGDGNCAKWAYHSSTADLAACQSKCEKLKCSCFDYEGGAGPPPAPSPTGNATGPDGEVWVAHTKLDGNTFGVVLAAELKSDYTFSIAADMGLAGKTVAYETNTTGALSPGATLSF